MLRMALKHTAEEPSGFVKRWKAEMRLTEKTRLSEELRTDRSCSAVGLTVNVSESGIDSKSNAFKQKPT